MSMRTSTLAVCTRPNFRRFVPLRFCVAKIWPGTRLLRLVRLKSPKKAIDECSAIVQASSTVKSTAKHYWCTCRPGQLLVLGLKQRFLARSRRLELKITHTNHGLVQLKVLVRIAHYHSPESGEFVIILHSRYYTSCILAPFCENGRAIILENGHQLSSFVHRTDRFPRLLLA